MSSRRSTRDKSPKSRLRMDSYQSRNGRSKDSPRKREREIDSVMKKARSQRSGSQSTYWNKKLLEAEEKDPNRWRHSGYKELYHGEKRSSRSQSGSGSLSKSKSRSRSPSGAKSPSKTRLSPRHRPRSPRRESRAKSPQERNWSPRRRSRGRLSYSRSPQGSRESQTRAPRRDSRGRSPRRDSRVRSPRRDSKGRTARKDSRDRSIRRNSRGRSPRGRSPRRESRGRSIERSRSPRQRWRSPMPRTPPRRPPSPRSKCRSESCSSDSSSSCSNDSCSVCSPKRKGSVEKEDKRAKSREKRSPERKRHERPKPRPPAKDRSRSRSFSIPRSRNENIPRNKRKIMPDKSVNRSQFIKVESDSDSSSRESVSAVGVVSNGPRISLSERFGRMAQWSVDRDLELRNLRITADRDRLTVEMDNPPSPLYPPSLSSINDLGSWDDVRVRYTYYKEHGYLRDLTLQDYVKWEQWWYKYQDWLDNDRYGYNYRRRP